MSTKELLFSIGNQEDPEIDRCLGLQKRRLTVNISPYFHHQAPNVTDNTMAISFSSLFSTFTEDCYAALFEFVGTVFFFLLGLGGIQAAASESFAGPFGVNSVEHVLYISTSMGLSLIVSAWLFFRVTGGSFNPDVTLALFLVGAIRPVRFVLFCVAELVGGIAASALILALTPGPLAFNTNLQRGINPAQGVFIEMFITSALVLSVLMLAAEKHQATPFAPIGIGLTLFATHLFAVQYTGASVNTARSFGPAVVTGFPSSNQWVYWVGPFLGSLLGVGFYTMLKHYNYPKLNPDQTAIEDEKSPRNPVDRAWELFTPVSETVNPLVNGGGEATSNGVEDPAMAVKGGRVNDSQV